MTPRERLAACADRLDLQIEAVDRQHAAQIKSHHYPADSGYTVYDMQDSRGNLVLAPLLAAQAQALAALAAIQGGAR